VLGCADQIGLGFAVKAVQTLNYLVKIWQVLKPTSRFYGPRCITCSCV